MKIFEFHDSSFKRFNNKPYYRGTWEPLRMEMFRLLPFQYKKSGSDLFQIYTIKDAIETDITSYFDGNNLLLGKTWTLTGTGTFFSSTSDYLITSFIPAANDSLTINLGGCTIGQKLHVSIDGTFTGSDYLSYDLYAGSDYVYGINGHECEYTYTIAKDDAYYLLIYANNGNNVTMANVTPKVAQTTLDIHSSYVTYNGGNLFNALPRGRCYFKINDGNGLYSEDADIDCVNFLLQDWPTYFTGSAGTPTYFTVSGKDVTRFQGVSPIYQAPKSNQIDVQKGEIIYVAFKQGSYSYWASSASEPIFYFYYDVGGTDTGTFQSLINPSTADRDGSIIYGKFTASKTGKGRIYPTPTSGVDISLVNCDVYKIYSDKCITLLISSLVDFGGTYYKGGFIQKLYKYATINRSPKGKVITVANERNGVLIKESIITATKFTITLKVTESEYEGLLEALPGTWTAYDQSGRLYTMNNIEIEDPEWNQGNGLCKISFEDNFSKFTYNNTAL